MWEKTVYGIPQPEYNLKSAYNNKKKDGDTGEWNSTEKKKKVTMESLATLGFTTSRKSIQST